MIGILVPVLARPKQVVPFLESVKNTTSEHRVYFVCSPGDDVEIKSCMKTDARVLVAPFELGPGDFAKKINWSFEQSKEPWLFQAADDVRFYPGWDTTALAIASEWGRSVIGTNDLGNPQVKRGALSTHTLFSRSYIDTYGGTADSTGKVFCELYDHQSVDNEFIFTARLRGEFVFAKEAVVEHLHPYWGKSKMDPTYKKATRATKSDMLLFRSRQPLIKKLIRAERSASAGVNP